MKSCYISGIIFIVFILSVPNQPLKSQQVYRLTIDSAISLAKEKSHRIRMLKENLNQATFRLKSIRRSFLPSLNFDGYLPSYREELKEFQDSAKVTKYPEKNRMYLGNFEFKQVLPTSGSISINYNVRNSDTYKQENSRMFESSTFIEFSQPLSALYAYNSMLARYKETKLNFELANKTYKREELNLIYNISYLFYTLVSAEKQTEISSQNVKRQEEAFTLAKNKYETGLIKEVEMLQIEVDYGEAVNNYDAQVTSFNQSANQLKQELGLSLNDSISTVNNLDYKVVTVDPENAIALGLKNRTEIRERQIQISLNELEVKRQRAEGTIQGDIGASYKLEGAYKTGLNTSYGSAYDNATRLMFNEPPKYAISFSVHIPIIDWGSNHSLVKMQKARLAQNKLNLEYELVTIENDIRSTVNRLQSNLRRLQLLEKNVKLAEKSYDISYLRFTNGDIDVETLGLDRIRYINAQQSYLQAYINYKLLLLDLNRKTFYDFEKNVDLATDAP